MEAEIKDFILPFMFDNHPIRGQWIQLDNSFQTVIARSSYPEGLRRLVGEALATVTSLGGISKHDGNISLQFSGNGAIKLISARTTSTNKIRAMIQWEGDIRKVEDLTKALGDGTLAVMYAPGGGLQHYQSIVEVEGSSITASIEQYFLQSEQLPTRMFISVTPTRVTGFMLQMMPGDTQKQQKKSWEHILTLAETVTDHELDTVHHEVLLRRLFVEEQIRLLPIQGVSFGCGCSKEKMQNAVLQLGKRDALSLLDEHDSIEVTCDFCGSGHDFDRSEVERLFAH